MSSFKALLTATLLGALVTAAVPAAPARAADGQLAPVMMVLDASGSMKDPLPSGGKKIDVARTAVHDLVGRLPAGTQLGLETYGTHDLPKDAGCRDVTVLRPPSAVDAGAVDAAVDSIAPAGWTPIGLALQTAAKQLPSTGPRSIVIVTDGADTCAPPDPCQVARDLEAQGADLRAYTIGLDVDDATRSQLTCIAQATGGTYTDAPDAGSLNLALNRVTQSAIRNYQPTGTPITGGDSPESAPAVSPGQYLDTLRLDGKLKYYAIDVPAGNTLYVSRTPAFPGYSLSTFLGSTVKIIDPRGEDCAADFGGGGASRDSVNPKSLIWRGVAGDLPDLAPQGCTQPGRYVVGMAMANPINGSSAGAPVPDEIQFGLEPTATDPGPAAATRKVGFTEPSGGVVPVTGGGSFGTAATLPTSGHYGDVLQYGEEVFYRVHLSWGQGLAWRVDYGQADKRRTVNIEAKTFTPVRQQVDWDTSAYTGDGSQLPSAGGQHPDGAFATYPVEYRNRTASDGTLRGESLDGWYYLTVKLGYGIGGADQPGGGNVPVTLDVAVVGSPQAGPRYEGQAAGSATPAQAPTPVEVFGGMGAPADSAATPPSSASSATATTKLPVNVALTGTASKKSGGGTPWAVFVLAPVAVAGSVATVVFIRKARRSV
ncbi:vWA domain-containing protein [Catenulispora subtropica]|uniref:VWFA domain-containing protein n=1 Tax=Catenulispora subtropica TaxID=450798 RepID=A0ABN2S5C5_9ACTN